MKRLLPLSMLLVGILLALALWHGLARRGDSGDGGGAGPAIVESRSAEASGETATASGQDQPVAKAADQPISDQDAIAIASKRLIAEFDADPTGYAGPTVQRGEAGIVVTFHYPQTPGWIGYSFRFTIDPKSGEILKTERFL